jgi:hypothetical protein
VGQPEITIHLQSQQLQQKVLINKISLAILEYFYCINELSTTTYVMSKKVLGEEFEFTAQKLEILDIYDYQVNGLEKESG